MNICRGDHWRNVARPESGTVCGLPGSLSIIETEAVRTPCLAGLNVITTRQLAPGATVGGQLLDWAKNPASRPVTVMPVMLSCPLPTLVSFTVRGGLVVPTVRRRGKVTLAGIRLTAEP